MTDRSKKSLQRRHIETLVAVADNHSVHRAAREMEMTQPAVSRLLTEAETLLGARIFERSALGSEPTAHGADLIAHARFVLRGIERLDDFIEASGPTVRLGCIPRAVHTLIPHILNRLYPTARGDQGSTARAAGFRLSVYEDSSEMLFEAISKSRLDFAIMRHVSGEAGIMAETGDSAGGGENLAVERLYDERPMIICAADNPELPHRTMPLAKLMDLEWILPSSETTSRRVLERFWSEQGFAPMRPIMETRTFESNLALVAETRFISVVPESIAHRYAELGMVRIVDVRPALPASPVMLVSHQLAEHDPVLRRFREIVRVTVLERARRAD
jgi:DNA-binding transcriptional LysR family regulator